VPADLSMPTAGWLPSIPQDSSIPPWEEYFR
jgi:hypothetical protein